MKKPIYVAGPNAKPIEMKNNKTLVAILPAGKGEKHNWTILSDGSFSHFTGSRFQGVGIERYVSERGYEIAGPDNTYAAKLTDHVAIRNGVSMLEKSTMDYAYELQKRFGGQRCFYVPFDPEKEIKQAVISQPGSTRCFMLGIGTGFSAGTVQVDWIKEEPELHRSDITLSDGWIVGPDGDPSKMPRSTEYGGLVEHAAFIIGNSGMATIDYPVNLTMEEEAPLDDEFCRGRIELAVTNSEDRVIVGIDAMDELVVEYVRDGKVIARREGLDELDGNLHIGAAVGAIAAIFVLVADMDEKAKGKASKVKKAA